MIADATVHTTGVNWESILAIIASMVIIVGAFVGWIGNSINKSVINLSDKLEAKLETKESVAKLATRVAVVESELMKRGRDTTYE